MRLFSVSLFVVLFCTPSYGNEIHEYLDFDFAYYEISDSSSVDAKSQAYQNKISIKTPEKFKALLLNNSCAMIVASSSALIIESSQRLPKMLEALVEHQVMKEYLGGRQIDHFSIKHQLMQAEGREAMNFTSIEIHYEDGVSSYYPASSLGGHENPLDENCSFFKEIELIDLIKNALIMELDPKYQRYGIDGATELSYLKLHVLGHAESWVHAIDMNPKDLAEDEEVCAWIKNKYNNLGIYMTCLEAMAFQRYFVLKVQFPETYTNELDLEVYYANVLAWVDETARVFEAFAQQWNSLTVK